MLELVRTQTKKISLKEEENQGLVHKTIEKYVLWRLQDWKNNPRVNALIWKSVLSVLSMTAIGVFIALTLYFGSKWAGSEAGTSVAESIATSFGEIVKSLYKVHLKSWVKLGFAIAGSTTLAYWNMSTMFNRKWSYCADLYNKILTLPSIENDQRDRLRNALAIDLLTLDLWAHRSFATLFRAELIKAIRQFYTPNNVEAEINRVESGGYSESDAMKVLEALNSSLVLSSPEKEKPLAV